MAQLRLGSPIFTLVLREPGPRKKTFGRVDTCNLRSYALTLSKPPPRNPGGLQVVIE